MRTEGSTQTIEADEFESIGWNDDTSYCEPCSDTGLVVCAGVDYDDDEMCGYCDWHVSDHPFRVLCPTCQP